MTNPFGPAATDSDGDFDVFCEPLCLAGTTEVATLNAGTSCVCCDLSGISWNDCDLSGEPTIEIEGIELVDASFENANLQCVQLTNPFMDCAVFDDASIVKSRFSGSLSSMTGSMNYARFRNAFVSGTFFVDIPFAVGVDFT